MDHHRIRSDRNRSLRRGPALEAVGRAAAVHGGDGGSTADARCSSAGRPPPRVVAPAERGMLGRDAVSAGERSELCRSTLGPAARRDRLAPLLPRQARLAGRTVCRLLSHNALCAGHVDRLVGLADRAGRHRPAGLEAESVRDRVRRLVHVRTAPRAGPDPVRVSKTFDGRRSIRVSRADRACNWDRYFARAPDRTLAVRVDRARITGVAEQSPARELARRHLALDARDPSEPASDHRALQPRRGRRRTRRNGRGSQVVQGNERDRSEAIQRLHRDRFALLECRTAGGGVGLVRSRGGSRTTFG